MLSDRFGREVTGILINLLLIAALIYGVLLLARRFGSDEGCGTEIQGRGVGG